MAYVPGAGGEGYYDPGAGGTGGEVPPYYGPTPVPPAPARRKTTPPAGCPEGQIRGADGRCAPGTPSDDAGCRHQLGRQDAVYREGACWTTAAWDCKSNPAMVWDDAAGVCRPKNTGTPSQPRADPEGERPPAPAASPAGPARIRSCPEGQARVRDAGGNIICRDIIRHVADAVGIDPSTAGGGGFDPRVDQPEPFRPLSFADILGDPRFMLADAAQQRQLRANAAASGVRGAPALGASAAASQGLLGNMANVLSGQHLAGWQANMARGQDSYNRMAGDFARRWTPVQAGLTHSLGMQAANLGAQQALWGRDDSLWNRWWLPASQQRQQAHARSMADRAGLWGLAGNLLGGGYQAMPLPI